MRIFAAPQYYARLVLHTEKLNKVRLSLCFRALYFLALGLPLWAQDPRVDQISDNMAKFFDKVLGEIPRPIYSAMATLPRRLEIFGWSTGDNPLTSGL